MEQEVLTFIQKRFKVDANWCDGNCYWFAVILKERFSMNGATIYYLPVTGHFVTKIQGEYYDWCGKVQTDEPAYQIDTLQVDEPAWYQRLVRDCMM